MKQQRQDIEGGKRRGEMLFAMTEIVSQTVALGLEGVVTAIPNSERVYVIPADQYPSMKLEQNGKSRVSASEIFEFGIADLNASRKSELVQKHQNENCCPIRLFVESAYPIC